MYLHLTYHAVCVYLLVTFMCNLCMGIIHVSLEPYIQAKNSKQGRIEEYVLCHRISLASSRLEIYLLIIFITALHEIR